MCSAAKLVIKVFVILNIHGSFQCPMSELADAKASYKSGEIQDQTSSPITLDKIKAKLKDTGIFDIYDTTLNEREKKELKKLFDAVEIMATSRNRQPQTVQNMFSSLRMMERVVKKQLKEGQISETLAAKFQWEKLSNRQKRGDVALQLDNTTKMRFFDFSS